MASFRGHLAASAALGAGYGAGAFWHLGLEPQQAALAAGLSVVGGVLPDLDSDSSLPNRVLFRLAALGAVIGTMQYLLGSYLSIAQGLVMIGGVYIGVRYVLARAFRRLTVHRGMFHSIPAMLIAGLVVYLLFGNLDTMVRILLAGAIIMGFLSHLALDEICAVDFRGARLKKPFGTALKLYSSSFVATAFCYAVLFSLAFLAFVK